MPNLSISKYQFNVYTNLTTLRVVRRRRAEVSVALLSYADFSTNKSA